MNFVCRQVLCEKLHLDRRTSFRLIKGRRNGGMLSSEDILAMLNSRRNKNQPAVSDVPSDIVTPKELCQEIKDTRISENRIRALAHRPGNPMPCFLLSSHTMRFSLKQVKDWLESIWN